MEHDIPDLASGVTVLSPGTRLRNMHAYLEMTYQDHRNIKGFAQAIHPIPRHNGT